SQPYIFKIFGTKIDLFLAAVHRVYDDTLAAFAAGLERHDCPPLEAMGSAFATMVTSRDEFLMLLQSAPAPAGPTGRAVVARGFHELYAVIQQHADADDYQVEQFIGYGLFLAAASGIGFQAAAKRPT